MKQKIKVAFFAETLQPDYDGAVRTMYQLIKRIPKEDFEFLFLCGEGPESIEGFKVIDLPAIPIPFNTNYKMVLPLVSNYKISDVLDQFQPNIVHISTPSPMGHFALKYARERAIPILSIYHTHFLSYIDYYLKDMPFLIEPTRNRLAKNSKAFYDDCDIVYIPTQEIIQYLANYRHRTLHMKLWQRGIDRHLFSPTKRNSTYLRQLTSNGKPNILFVSRLVWEKNLDTLIGFYQLLEAKRHPYNLLIAGDGLARTELEIAMPKAHFLGALSHEKLSVVYASADVFLFPSVTETYGNVVIEAMASGLPCVIANGGGSKSFIQDGQNGFLCQPTQASDYYEKIEQLLRDKNLYQQFVQAGLKYVEPLNWDELAKVYFNDLRQLAQAVAAVAA